VASNDWRASKNQGQDNVDGHKFKVGQNVNYTSGPFDRRWVRSVYKIMQLLPPQGGEFQYRIKSADEPHDRVAKESEIDRIA